MKTSLHLEAPSDLSVGRVHISGQEGTVKEWIATPGNRNFNQEGIAPGFYTVEIGPAGLPPQSVLFEVKEGEENKVALPPFAVLASTGNNVTFFDVGQNFATADIPLRATPSGTPDTAESNYPYDRHDGVAVAMPAPLALSLPSDIAVPIAATDRIELPASSPSQSPDASIERSLVPLPVESTTRRISIGLSQEKENKKGFGRFAGIWSLETTPNGLEIEVDGRVAQLPSPGTRVQLSMAIENLRIEQCLVPMYRGGTTINVKSSPLSAIDVELQVTPRDARLRALLRALHAGTSKEAEAVRDGVLTQSSSNASLPDVESDPWGAILAGLLTIRFPLVFQSRDASWLDMLAKKASWAFDAQVIRANHILLAAGELRESQDKAVNEAVPILAAALATGKPYYSYANQLFGEMAGGLAEVCAMKDRTVSPTTRRSIDDIAQRWRRELAPQRSTAPTYSWRSPDPRRLNENSSPAPDNQPDGSLSNGDTAIAFEGRIGAGLISFGKTEGQPASRFWEGFFQKSIRLLQNWVFRQATPSLPESGSIPPDADGRSLNWADCPAMQRPPGPRDDPNKGRFGGKASVSGFRISAEFGPGSRDQWVTIDLILRTDPNERFAIGEHAWFFLHPTFSPHQVKVMFRGRRATLSVQAYGGFTVGVWLPKHKIELECDLALLPDAPRIVRER